VELAAMFDVAVVGGGVVGCAVARRFTLQGASVVLLEKGADILSGASKGNSAILHTGFDAPAGSLELACMQAGYKEYLEIREKLGLPLLESSAIVAAWNEEQQAKLAGIEAAAHANGVADVQAISRDEILQREPALSERVLGGVLVPGEYLIDPWSAPLAYLLQALENGAEVRRNTEVLSGAFDRVWRLETSTGPVQARYVINAAGLFGDVVDELLTGAPGFTIKPRKGQFVVFDKAASKLLRAILLPVPEERTKGIVLTPTVFGNLLVGPTAEEQESRDRADTDAATLQMLVDKAVEMLPALRDMPVTAIYAGIRPATEEKTYRVRHEAARKYIVLGGIRSTGLTAALGLAQHAWDLYGGKHEAVAAPVWPQAPRLAEHCPRDWQEAGYGEIICHCEMVTRREVEAAMEGALPATDWGGLKRRTRAGMGRCQGFYCNAALAALTAGRLLPPLAEAVHD
jgi:glycerol-3-phosphate dehydrogenase